MAEQQGGEQRKSRSETETWILSVLETEGPLPLEELLDALTHFGSAGSDRRVDGWAELIQDALSTRGEALDMLRVLALRCQWRPHEAAFKGICADAVERAFPSRLGKVLFKNAGFSDPSVTAAEAVRRMNVLARLKDGVFCADKTWGFGVVRRVDDFYERVTIDFDRKRSHEMSMTYAAETLDLVPPSHFLVRLHKEQAAIRQMVEADPAALIRLVLESYGPLNVDAIKAHLVDRVMPESGWKHFWDAARKALKADPLVHLPPKRTDPVKLLESADAHVVAEFAALEGLRGPEAILKKIDAMEAAGLLGAPAPARRAILAERLAFAVWGAEDREPALAVRALLTAERMGLPDAEGLLGTRRINPAEVYAAILDGKLLQEVLHALPVRMMAAVIERFIALFPDRAAARLLDMISSLAVPVLQEAMPRLREGGAGERLESVVRGRLQARNAGPALLFWLLRNPEGAASLVGSDPAELLRQGVDALEWPAAGEMLKAQHQLRALYESGDWLGDRLEALSAEQRTVFVAKLLESRGWDETGRRSVLAGIIKRYPELQALVSGRPDAAAPKARARMTAWRSYRERQNQFQRLLEVEIPENAREIAVARSYGDLRENAEFKYAKEHQRILYRRRDEMELDLENVKGTDFAGCGCDAAGMGTEVEIRRPDGRLERYRILGEWDRDESLNIISSLSQVAKQLEGHHVGDTAELPGAAGLDRCEVVAIAPLGPEVQAWLSAGAPSENT
jgi:transcription elongation GreA/GreB family factor